MSIGLGIQTTLTRVRRPVSILDMLPTYKAALAAQQAGTSEVRILGLGDSTTKGVGGGTDATSPVLSSWLARLAPLFSARGHMALDSMLIPQGVQLEQEDRWTIGGNPYNTFPTAGWNTFGGLGFFNGQRAETPTQNLVLSPGIAADRFVVHYLRNGGTTGPLKVEATGVSEVTVNTGAGSGIAFEKLILNCPTVSASNTVTFKIGSSFSFVGAVEAIRSGAPQVRLLNGGVAYREISEFNAMTAGWGFIPLVTSLAPHLSIVNCMINSAAAGKPVATWLADLQTHVGRIRGTGSDVLVLSAFPQSGVPANNLLKQYRDSARTWCRDNGVAFLDVMGDVFGDTYSASVGFDGVHPNSNGYQLWAQYLANHLIP